MRIGIIGMGHVGQAMSDLFDSHAELTTFDIARDDDYPNDELSRCDFAIVAVDTPPGEGGGCDVSRVRDAVEMLPVNRILLKSTVPPGTTDRLREETGKQICFSPEYVGESAYYQPFWLDPRVEPMHTAVFPEARGCGGKCLPKDMDAIVSAARSAGYDPLLLAEVVRSNHRFRAAD